MMSELNETVRGVSLVLLTDCWSVYISINDGHCNIPTLCNKLILFLQDQSSHRDQRAFLCQRFQAGDGFWHLWRKLFLRCWVLLLHRSDDLFILPHSNSSLRLHGIPVQQGFTGRQNRKPSVLSTLTLFYWLGPPLFLLWWFEPTLAIESDRVAKDLYQENNPTGNETQRISKIGGRANSWQGYLQYMLIMLHHQPFVIYESQNKIIFSPKSWS